MTPPAPSIIPVEPHIPAEKWSRLDELENVEKLAKDDGFAKSSAGKARKS
jgi:lipoate synthase